MSNLVEIAGITLAILSLLGYIVYLIRSGAILGKEKATLESTKVAEEKRISDLELAQIKAEVQRRKQEREEAATVSDPKRAAELLVDALRDPDKLN